MPSRTPSQERWLRFFNQVIYASMASVYGALDWLTLGVWWRLVRRAMRYVPRGSDVLEVGFGPGKLLVQLAKTARLCVGVDLAWGMCRFTQQRLRRAGLPLRIVRGSVFELPCRAEAFDVVVTTFAFSGFADGMEALREMTRLTKPGGRVVVVDIGLPRDGNRAGMLLARVWERMGDFLYDQAAMMQAAGLEVVTYEEFGPGNHIRAVVGEKRSGN